MRWRPMKLTQAECKSFYADPKWRRKRKEILKKDKYECQIHKAKGQYVKACIVHHVKHLDEYPELGLEEYYIDDSGKQQRQLISVCRECHETECHPERLRWNITPQLNEERW